MDEVKKCPKCGGEIEKGDRLVGERGLLSVFFFQQCAIHLLRLFLDE